MSDPASGRTDCAAQRLEIAGVKIGFVDYRVGNRGGVIILGDLTGQCVAIADLKKQFGPGFEHSACTDGVVCIYQSFKRFWGSLNAGLGKDLAATCAQEVTFSLRSQ